MNEAAKSEVKEQAPSGRLKPLVSDLGHDFMEGVLRCLAKYVILGYILLLLFSLARNWRGWDTDESDKDGWHRSGLRIHTDAKTGIQYLSDGHGGLVRREYR